MPVINEANKVLLNANGVLTDFNFDFKYFENEDLIVKTVTPSGVETLVELNTDYTVSSDDKNAGGTIVFSTAPATGKVLIKRTLPLEQGANFRPVSGFPEQVITDGFDRGTMVAQDLQEQINRCMILPESSTITNLSFPYPEAGKVPKWNDGGTALENSSISIDDIQSSLDEAAASAAASAASAAIAQAATGSMPTPVASNYLRQKSNSSGFEYVSPANVLDHISTDILTPVAKTGTSVTLEEAKIQTLTTSGTTTLSLPSTLKHYEANCMIKIAQGGTAYTVNQPSGVLWKNGVPDLTTINKKYTLIFWTIDNGTTWEGTWFPEGSAT